MVTPRNTPARQRGLSLIEGLAALCVLSILVGGTLPDFEQMRRTHALKGVAALLETDIQLARSEAVARNLPVRLTLNPDGGAGSCYVVHTGPADACHCGEGQAARCEAPAVLLRSETLPAEASVQVRSSVRSILFDGTLGTSTPAATLRVQTPSGVGVNQVVNVVGRIRSCAHGGAVSGFRAC